MKRDGILVDGELVLRHVDYARAEGLVVLFRRAIRVE